jgi:hypothetical protein
VCRNGKDVVVLRTAHGVCLLLCRARQECPTYKTRQAARPPRTSCGYLSFDGGLKLTPPGAIATVSRVSAAE